MSINFRTLLTKAKQDIVIAEQRIHTFETKVTAGVTELALSATNIMDSLAVWLTKLAAEEPAIIADLNSPIAQEIASLLPNGTVYLQEVVTLLNRVLPYLKNAQAEALVFDGIIHHVAANIVSILHGAVETTDQYIADVQQLFLPAPVE